MRKILLALALVLGLTLPIALTSGTASAALSCSYSPSTRIMATYAGSICFKGGEVYPTYSRTRITCEYYTPGIPGNWDKHDYTVRSGIVGVGDGTWAWAYCGNHGQYKSPGVRGPDWVLHACVEFDPNGSGGGYTCAY